MDEQTNSPNDNPPQPTDDEANLRELALALIAARYPDATDGEELRLLPGQLPPNFPGDFPLPPGAHIVGSLAATRSSLALDTGQLGAEVIAFYRERLTAAGWTAPDDMMPRQGGFLHSGMGMAGQAYLAFYRDDGQGLNLMTHATPAGRTSVLISQMPEGAGRMHRGARGRRMHPDIFSVLPPIMSPPNAQQHQEGGSGGDDRLTTSARVETDLDLPALIEHYHAQLEQGGWQRQQSGENGPVAWSTWTFEDQEKEPWRALFVILKRPDVPRLYWLHIVAEWAGKRSSDGPHTAGSFTMLGWQSHTSLR